MNTPTLDALKIDLKRAKQAYRARIDLDPDVIAAKAALGAHLAAQGLSVTELLEYLGTSNRATVLEYLRAAEKDPKTLPRYKKTERHAQVDTQEAEYWSEDNRDLTVTTHENGIIEIRANLVPSWAWSAGNTARPQDKTWTGYAKWDEEAFLIDAGPTNALHGELLARNPFFTNVFRG